MHVVMKLYEELEEKDACELHSTKLGQLQLTPLNSSRSRTPALPTRPTLVRLLLEHFQHLAALAILSTDREEDFREVKSAYLEGWAWYVRAEPMTADPALLSPSVEHVDGEEEENSTASITAEACLPESMWALIECARLFAEQDYPVEGIGSHVKEL